MSVKEKSKAPARVEPGYAPDEQLKRGIGTQKARTMKDEKAAWGRRLNRYKRKAIKAGGTPEDINRGIEAMRDASPGTYTAESTGLLFWRYKAELACGTDMVAGFIAATLAYKNG